MDYRLNILPPEPLTKAAVLVPIVEHQGKFELILTRRSEKVRHHKGQISFPGGMHDPTDTNLWHTALRETHEEIGITPQGIYYVHQLPQLITPTSFDVTPFVGFLTSHPELKPNPDEIEEIIFAPLDFFKDTKNLHFEDRDYFGQKYPVPFFSYGNHSIWGATGRIILSLLESWK